MNKYSKVLSGLAMFASVSAQAAVMSVSGHAFDDRSTSVVDQSTSLEWMDFSATMTRSTCSMAKDAGSSVPAGCADFDNQDLIVDADGWRVATRQETSQLLSNWFGVAVGERTQGNIDTSLAIQFLDVFADGAMYVRPNFYPDYASSNTQAVGFMVGNWGSYSMDYYNGDIYGVGLGTAMVRDVAADVPEPGSLALLGLALPALLLARRRRS
jgi:hypothetical protein